jgi:hypothetical protein
MQAVASIKTPQKWWSGYYSTGLELGFRQELMAVSFIDTMFLDRNQAYLTNIVAWR